MCLKDDDVHKIDEKNLDEGLKKLKYFAARAAEALIADFERRFPFNGLLNAFAILLPHYWRAAPDSEEGQEAFLIDANKKLKVLLEVYAKPVKFGRKDVPALVEEFQVKAQWADFQGVMAHTKQEPYNT